MQIEIWTLGKKHDPDLKSAIERYEKRLKHYCKLEWKIINPSKKKDAQDIRKEESEILLKMMASEDHHILLDERGHSWDNAKWKQKIANHQLSNPHKLIYIIGGAYGVDESVRSRCTVVSISPLILPHQIVRLILVEQLYRSFSIMRGTGYHHD